MRVAARFVVLSLLLSALVAFPWSCVVSGMLDTDPLFGRHAELVCPHVCSGCRAPYRFLPTDQGHSIYCSDPSGERANAWPPGGKAAMAPYHLPGQEALIALTLTVALLPLGAVVAVLLRRRRRG
jgi:hypothetical protein